MSKVRRNLTPEDIAANEDRICRLKKLVSKYSSIRKFSDANGYSQAWITNLTNGTNRIREEWLRELEERVITKLV